MRDGPGAIRGPLTRDTRAGKTTDEEEDRMNTRKVLVGVGAARTRRRAPAAAAVVSDSETYKSSGMTRRRPVGSPIRTCRHRRASRWRSSEINAEGGIAGKWKIELTLQDNRSEAAQSAVVAQDLISKGVQFLICTSDADPCTAAGQIAQKAGRSDDVDRRDVADASSLGR